MSPEDPRHGTNAGHRAHYGPRGDGTPCGPCRAAHAEYKRTLWRRKYLARVEELYVPSIGTTRRIRALQALGWRLTDIDAALGHGDGDPRRGGPNYAHNLTRQPRVHIDTAAKVARVFDRLSMQLGPSARTRAMAARLGWAPPLAYDDIDDPYAGPIGVRGKAEPKRTWIDPIVVNELLAGRTVDATRAEKAEAMRRWLASGKSARSLEVRHGWHSGRYMPRRQEESA